MSPSFSLAITISPPAFLVVEIRVGYAVLELERADAFGAALNFDERVLPDEIDVVVEVFLDDLVRDFVAELVLNPHLVVLVNHVDLLHVLVLPPDRGGRLERPQVRTDYRLRGKERGVGSVIRGLQMRGQEREREDLIVNETVSCREVGGFKSTRARYFSLSRDRAY